ncbi:MAG: 1-deoxy-D-xylulose-5-phosphate reductoisomerase [Candidatus Cloacimonadota bacterium]|nr:1-deoxy-D-xylulose-5-phosphate reductoisomerase [Candidatus Cloacimonadota bacterium]
MKRIVILGITGSIGTSALNIVRNHQREFKIVFASAHSNLEKLIKIAKEFKLSHIHLTNDKVKYSPKIKQDFDISFGENELQNVLKKLDFDIMLNAISGSAGLRSSITCIELGNDLALANKESLVMAGHIIMPMLKKSKARLLPVDSEHSAILQAIGDREGSEIKKIHITASGGPFRTLPLNKFSDISFEDSLNHPTWSMGTKITIDSATMMNKGLEIIEAHHLFEIPYSQIQAIIHPQSIIHSMVEFIDGSIIAQMSEPTMELPILYAFSYPEHISSNNVQTDLFALSDLSFEKVDYNRYPLFQLALRVGEAGGILPTIMNAANEATISLFESKRIRFVDIYKIVEKVIKLSKNIANPDLDTIIQKNKSTYKNVIDNYKELL